LASRRSASLDAVVRFIAGDLDDQRIEGLLWGLVLVDPRRSPRAEAPLLDAEAHPLPREYALLKLLFLHHPIQIDGQPPVKPEASILTLLGANALGQACKLGVRRLRASGVVPMPRGSARRPNHDDDWNGISTSYESKRIAGALLIPVGLPAAGRLASMVLARQTDPAIAVE